MQALCTVIIAGLLLMAALYMPYSHDEESYVFGAKLASELVLYADFVYLQPPNHALYLSFILGAIDANYYLASRLSTFAIALLFFFTTTWIASTVSASRFDGVMAGLLAVFSTTMIPAFGSARNDCLAATLALLGVGLVLRNLYVYRPPWVLSAISGALLALAVGTKITYAFAPFSCLVVLVYLTLVNGKRNWSTLHLAGFILGGIVGSAPLLYYAVASPVGFFYGMFGHHFYAAEAWHQQNNAGYLLSDINHFLRASDFIIRDVALVCCCAIVVIFAYRWKRSGLRRTVAVVTDPVGLLLVLLVLSALPLVFAPRPAHLQYFQPLIPCLIFLTVHILRQSGLRAALPSAAFAALVAVACIPGAVRYAEIYSTGSTVSDLRADAVALDQQLRSGSAAGAVATLYPIRVLDAGYEVMPEFSAGPFFFRTADALEAERIVELQGTSPTLLATTLSADFPVALYTGVGGLGSDKLDAPFLDFAAANGYRRASSYSRRGTLYLAPDSAVRPSGQ